MAAAGTDDEARFTVAMSRPTWRALRREADDQDISRSAILEALYECHQRASDDERAAILARALEITTARRRRGD